MKKFLAAALFACSLFLAAPQAHAYSELDLLEGNWYDDNGNLFAIVRDGRLNTFRMDMITGTERLPQRASRIFQCGGKRQGEEQPVLPPDGTLERRQRPQGMVPSARQRL